MMIKHNQFKINIKASQIFINSKCNLSNKVQCSQNSNCNTVPEKESMLTITQYNVPKSEKEEFILFFENVHQSVSNVQSFILNLLLSYSSMAFLSSKQIRKCSVPRIDHPSRMTRLSDYTNQSRLPFANSKSNVNVRHHLILTNSNDDGTYDGTTWYRQ